MRDLSALVEAAAGSEEGKMFWFVEFQFDTYINYTDADIDLWVDINPYDIWQFKNSDEGFVGDALTIIENSDSVTLATTSSDPKFIKTSTSIVGANYPIINIRMRRLGAADPPGWDGSVYYSTSGHNFSGSYRKTFSEPSNFSEYQEISLDMRDLTAGGTDWSDNTITTLRFDFGTGVGDNFEIDHIKISSASTKFDSIPFSVGNINYTAQASVDKLVVDIQNIDLIMSATLLNEDIRGKWGIVYIAFFDANNVLINYPIEVFRGLVSTWKLSEPKVSIPLVNEFIFWNKKTLRKHQDSCRWAFKGTECTYSGIETWCDQEYARCSALGNTDNFGGFRWLPDLSEKKLYWGRAD